MLDIFIYTAIYIIGISGISLMLDFAFEDRKLFRPYYLWLLEKAEIENDIYGAIVSGKWFFEPLGGCIYCMNFWIVNFTLPFLLLLCGFPPFLLIALSLTGLIALINENQFKNNIIRLLYFVLTGLALFFFSSSIIPTLVLLFVAQTFSFLFLRAISQ